MEKLLTKRQNMSEMSVKRPKLSEICRLCLTKDCTVLDIFHFSDEMNNQLANIIMSFAPVQIKRHDEMPNSICHLCYTHLKNIHKFQMQIIQSDKTLRQCLQQLHTSDQQIKSEFSIQNSPEERITQKTNHCDVPEKCESLGFRMNVPKNKMASINNEMNETVPLKFEIKDEPTDDNSLNLIECVDADTVKNSRGDGSEFVCEATKVEVSYYTKLDKRVYSVGNEDNFKSANTINQDVPLTFKIKDEPANDISSNLIECADDIVETVYNTDDSEICSENSRINKDNIPGNSEAECLGKSEERKKDIAVNYENQKQVTEKKYFCDICNKGFNKFCVLKTHKLIHTSEKPYQCDICNKCFRQINTLNNHKLAHTGEKPYQCDVCNKCFIVPNKLNRHKRTHTGEKPYQCNVCNKCFSESSNLYIHKRIHTGEKPYQCDVCNKKFTISTHLNNHKRTHTGEKPYQCDVCSKSFAMSSHLITHKRTHTGEKPYQCDVCNKCFSQLAGFIKHKRTHTGEKPYKCDVCNMCFIRSDALNYHKRTHTGEKPYRCDVCNKCFDTMSNLNTHQHSHTGEKPYQCDVCSKCFSQLAGFIKHKRTHNGEKPDQCDVSNKGFSQSRDLNINRGTHPAKKSYQCIVKGFVNTLSQTNDQFKLSETHTG